MILTDLTAVNMWKDLRQYTSSFCKGFCDWSIFCGDPIRNSKRNPVGFQTNMAAPSKLLGFCELEVYCWLFFVSFVIYRLFIFPGDDNSLLVVILDVNPVWWGKKLLKHDRDVSCWYYRQLFPIGIAWDSWWVVLHWWGATVYLWTDSLQIKLHFRCSLEWLSS